MTRKTVGMLVMAAVLAAAPPSRAGAQERTTFVSIDQEDRDTAEADERLRQILEAKLGESLSSSSLGYGEAINRLSEWSETMGEKPYLARVTPYVYIAAEMLGADFEVLGTYDSKATTRTTYHSYFVVNRRLVDSTLELGGKRPDLDTLLEVIRRRAEAGSRVRFVYHNRFSTSSYFLPALFFRRNNVFSMRASTSSLTAIDSRLVGGDSSTALVEQVAAGEQADLAAVWDGTKVKFEGAGEQGALGGAVYFIQLPTVLPNDLLVCSRSLLQRQGGGATAKKQLVQRLFGSGPEGPGSVRLNIGRGDFRAWLAMDADALYALGSLRVLAAEQRTPIAVRIQGDGRVPETYLQSARLALRLSGTELTPYDDSFHRIEDYVWTLGWVRDGYITLSSDIPAFGVQQQFRISFRPAAPGAEEADLTQRIAGIVSSRLHRVRYVWPYEEDRPLVIRDVPFAPGSAVKVQRIHWTEPARNGYTGDNDPRPVAVESADLFKFRLSKEAFRLAMGDSRGVAPLDPMSTVAYRVVLQRPDEPQAMYKLFDGVFVLLLLLAAAGTFVALRAARRAQPAAGDAGPVLPDAAPAGAN